MASVTYSIQPQRSSRKGWQDCLQHEAERFIVREHKAFTHKGKAYKSTRMVTARAKLSEAKKVCDQLNRKAAPSPVRRLGQRFARTGHKIIARSLSYEQYHGLEPPNGEHS